jgi:tetratricopeptide (TPR) repeat protein
VPLAEPRFSGRNQELELLLKHLELAIHGKGTTLFVSGEAGAGKTRLVNEFLSLARERNVETITGYCLSTVAVPYFPFIEAFNAYSKFVQSKSKHVESEVLGLVGWLKGEESTEAEPLGIRAWLVGPKQSAKPRLPRAFNPEMRKNMTYAAIADELKSMSAKAPVVLFLDDLQWADSASLSLLHYICRLTVSSWVLIVGAFRSEEVSSVSEGHAHPLVETMRAMSREDLYVEVRVARLSEPDVARLAESMVGGAVDHRLIEKLTEESQGNPLFAIESLRLLMQSGNLVREKDKWRSSVDKFAILDKVKDVIMRRLQSLNSTQRRLLDLASVAGERIDPTMLGTVLSMDKLLVLENLHQISHFALLINSSDSLYTFGHAKFREVLYEELSPPLKREYHARVAEIMENEARAREETPVNELAFHYAQAGNEEKSTQYALLAGEDALKRYSNAEAIEHFSYVLGNLPADMAHARQRIIAQEGLGDAYYAVGSFEKARETFEKLGETESGIVSLRALRKTMAASFQLGHLSYMIELANRAGKEKGSDRLEDGRIRVYKAQAIGMRGNVNEAVNSLEDCLRIFEKESSLPDVANASCEISQFYSYEYRVTDALYAIRRSIELYMGLRDPFGEANARFYEGLINFNCGRTQEALESFSKAVEIGGKVGDFPSMSRAIVYSGQVHESLGEMREALACSLRGVEYAEKTDSYYTQCIGYANATRNYARLGDQEHAEEYYKKFSKLFTEIGHTASRLLYAGGARTQADFFAAKGQWSEANKHFEECIDLYKGAMWTNFHEAMARTDYALILAKQAKIAEAKAQIEEASRLYAKSGNNPQIARLDKLLKEICGSE